MRPVAMGEDVGRGSTIWVEKSEGLPLDDVLRARAVPFRVRREIVLETAEILRRMRQMGLHHRDMYLCHLIVDLDAEPGRRLTVIDLQRARGRPRLRERWFVKDVAQLWFSSPRPPLTRTDAVRFLRRYFAVDRLGPAERKFAARVLRKVSRIARHNREPWEAYGAAAPPKGAAASRVIAAPGVFASPVPSPARPASCHGRVLPPVRRGGSGGGGGPRRLPPPAAGASFTLHLTFLSLDVWSSRDSVASLVPLNLRRSSSLCGGRGPPGPLEADRT